MIATKNSTLTFRVKPALKEALRAAAEAEHRSVANMIEVLIRDHCKRQDIVIQDRPDSSKSRNGRRK